MSRVAADEYQSLSDRRECLHRTSCLRLFPSATAPSARERRLCGTWTLGIMAGLAVHGLFAVTVWSLFWFLKRDWQAPKGSLWWDCGLALQFAVVHSALLHPRIRTRLSRWIASPFYGLFFTAVTCIGLFVVFAGWKSHHVVLWDCQRPWRWGLQLGFYVSWVALFYSLALSGLGYQTGWTPWWSWVRGAAPRRRSFEERGLYRWFRHPIYLSFLGLIWFTPHMTLDHAVLTGIWTVYIGVGSWLKDRRLEQLLGAKYREYESRVPGYPGLNSGPLGLRSWHPAALEANTRRRVA